MDHFIEEAFRIALHTEMNSYHLYQGALSMMPDGSDKQVLKRLAHEESNLIKEILQYCPDSVRNTIKHLNNQHFAYYGSLKDSPKRRLFNQLRIFLLDKHVSIERYTTFVNAFKEPAVCTVFELALSMSRKLFALIAEQYRQADLSLHKPSNNKRAKRAHLRTGNLTSPNKHSQVFISLKDTGVDFPP